MKDISKKEIIDNLFAKTEKEAQEYLDENYFGYSIKVESDGSGVIFDEEGNKLVQMTSTESYD